MLRWNNVNDTTLFGMTIKAYRDPFEFDDYFIAPFENLDLDHYAFKYMQSELYMYRILDSNFEEYIEERGDVSKLTTVKIPIRQNTERTIL